MVIIENLQPISFQLVIEIEPYQWSSRNSPKVSPSRLYPEEWLEYFNDCMKDAGFESINPIRPGSFFVDAFSLLGTSLLDSLIKNHLQNAALPGFPDEEGYEDQLDGDYVSKISGGVAILSGDKVLLEPECCCDFTNLYEWKDLIETRPASSKVWIGHPQAQVNFNNDLVTISEGCEYSPAPDYLVQFSVEFSELKNAVQEAEKSLKQFKSRLYDIVKKIFDDPELAKVVTTCLTDYN